MNLFENLQKMKESNNNVYYPNGEIVSDNSVDMDKFLTYMYGHDRDMDNSHYTTDEKQRSVDYWFKKNEPNSYKENLKESTDEEDSGLKVCRHCLDDIISREGKQNIVNTYTYYDWDEDAEPLICDWCEAETDELYEIDNTK